jgi:hypothetical protein
MEFEESQVGNSAANQQFEKVVEESRAVKNAFVDKQFDWYRKHRLIPFLLFRSAGVLTIVLSVSLPAVAAIEPNNFHHKNAVLGLMGLAIAGLTSLSTFYRWERTWKSRTLTEFTIEAFSAKWELEMVNAPLLIDQADRLRHVYLATNDLIANVTNVCTSESEGFFSGMQFPQSQPPK